MIKNLQVLRSIAALLVAYYHFGFYNSKVGFFGVDIFFVISGFIMSYVLYKNKDDFFMKRVIRIVPMYWIVTILISVLWLQWPHLFHNVYVDGPSFTKSFLFIPYSKFTSGPILSSGWTLNCEMYFYLLLGFFLIFTRSVKKILLFTCLLLLAICLLQIMNYTKNYFLSFYGSSIMIEFIFGIALYWFYNNYREHFSQKSVLFLLGVISVLSFFAMVYSDLNKIEGYRLFFFGIPSFCITSFFVFSENTWRTDTKIYKWLYRLGNASYVIYLIHPFVMNIFLRLIHPLLKTENLAITFTELVLSMLFICLVSDFVHRKIEKPLLKKIEILLIK